MLRLLAPRRESKAPLFRVSGSLMLSEAQVVGIGSGSTNSYTTNAKLHHFQFSFRNIHLTCERLTSVKYKTMLVSMSLDKFC